jgi:hypothetical protein
LLASLSISVFEKGSASSSQSRNGVEQFLREVYDASSLVFAHEAFHSGLFSRLKAPETQEFIKEVLNLVVIGLTALFNVHHQLEIFQFLRKLVSVVRALLTDGVGQTKQRKVGGVNKEELGLEHGEVKKEASMDEYTRVNNPDGSAVVLQERLRRCAIDVELKNLKNFALHRQQLLVSVQALCTRDKV